MNTRVLMLFAASACLVLPGVAAARLLVDADGLRVKTEQAIQCASAATLRMDADHPDLLALGSSRVQGVFDAARAMLSFECRDIPEITVIGRLNGLSEVSWRATASAHTGWMLDQGRDSSAAVPMAIEGRFKIRTLTTGIGVAEAMQRARQAFPGAPTYDSRRRELEVVDGQCDAVAGSDPRPGWTCLRAGFTDAAEPRLYRMQYSQVVDQDQSTILRNQLIERYGAPVLDRQVTEDGDAVSLLEWGDPVVDSIDQVPPNRHEMQARIRLIPGGTVVNLDLLDSELGRRLPRYQARF